MSKEFKKGQELECSNYDNWAVVVGECRLIDYYQGKETPYLVEWKNNNKIELFKYARTTRIKEGK